MRDAGRRVLWLGFFLGLVWPAWGDDVPRAPELATETFRLPNGMKVVLHRDPSIPRVVVCVAYHVGSKNERAGRTGFAHFFEHMMFRGTKNVPDYDIPLQEAGGDNNAFTSEDMTVYFETVPSEYLERALYLEAERLAFLPTALDQEKFDTEREVVKNERLQSVDNVPYGMSEEVILSNVYPAGHPYSWSVIGSMADLNRASLDDLKQFFGEFYHPGNATLSVAGDFDVDQVKKWVAQYFAPLAAGPALRPVRAEKAPVVDTRIERTDKVQLPRLYWVWHTVGADHPDAPALDLLAGILSSGDASRLQNALVREARVATDVSASSNTKEIAGLFEIRATAAEGVEIEKLEAALTAELNRLATNPPTDEERRRALTRDEQRLNSSLTTTLSRATVLAVGLSEFDDVNRYRTDFEREARVTTADLARVAKTYLTPQKFELVIRPAAEGDPANPPVVAGPGADSRPESRQAERTPAAGPDWSVMPGPTAAHTFTPPGFTRARLENGVEVWMAPWRTLPLVSMRLLVPAGTGLDPAGKSGLAALTGRLLDQGSTSRTAPQVASELDSLGASLNVGMNTDWTTYHVNLLARSLEPTLAIVGDVLQHPRFDRADFDREQSLQIADLTQGPDNPSWLAQRAMRALLYGQAHPYGNPAQGFIESVKGLGLADVRAFHHDHFGPQGSILIVVGDFDPDTVLPQLQKVFGGWSGQSTGKVELPAVPAGRRQVVHLLDKPGAVQSVVGVARVWVDRGDPRYFATLLGNRILGADFLSRLNKNLRVEHGYTYGAGSNFLYRREGSTWSILTQVRADATAESLREILKELNDLAGTRPFDASEIQTAHVGESRGFPKSFESPSGITGELQELAEFELPDDTLATYLGRLQGTSDDAVRQAMTEVVEPSQRVILVVGDRATVEPALRKLGFDQIVPIDAQGQPLPDTEKK